MRILPMGIPWAFCLEEEMGYYEAIQDNVRISKDKNGDTWYYPKCQFCGAEVPNWAYKRGVKYTCNDCKKNLIDIDKELKIKEKEPNRERKLKTALGRIAMYADIRKYDEAVNRIMSHINDQVWFDSTEEVMVGLQLLKKKIQFKIQYKVRSYKCDFYLPDLNVVIEVDGELFHTKETKEKEEYRDAIIKKDIGADVIRIPASLINENVTRLTPAIYAYIKKLKGLDYKSDLEKARHWKKKYTVAFFDRERRKEDRYG